MRMQSFIFRLLVIRLECQRRYPLPNECKETQNKLDFAKNKCSIRSQKKEETTQLKRKLRLSRGYTCACQGNKKRQHRLQASEEKLKAIPKLRSLGPNTKQRIPCTQYHQPVTTRNAGKRKRISKYGSNVQQELMNLRAILLIVSCRFASQYLLND